MNYILFYFGRMKHRTDLVKKVLIDGLIDGWIDGLIDGLIDC